MKRHLSQTIYFTTMFNEVTYLIERKSTHPNDKVKYMTVIMIDTEVRGGLNNSTVALQN